ncbi:DNA-binding enhancer protein-like protein [Actinidia rufa]|uniref:DNA-binding enhancer protein-like protein n=1 Tax=Actinidia rufa TaxID=165716 RepID=A0A7J0HF39_9ERIC|nr:DNA-binding enhancer protein-like protein [Actinidia rufa]
MEGGDEGIERVENSKDLQQQSKALDKLTDHVEDRQLDSTRVQEAMASIYAAKEADLNAMRMRRSCHITTYLKVYKARIFQIVQIDHRIHIGYRHSLNALEQVSNTPLGRDEVEGLADEGRPRVPDGRQREKELAAVKINAADVDIIAFELELDKKVAERTLREHKGDAVAAIQYLLR